MSCLEDKIDECERLLEKFSEKIKIDNLKKNYKYSKKRIYEFREIISSSMNKYLSNFSIILVGSFGRLESSKLSDLDYSIVYKDSLYKFNSDYIEGRVGDILSKTFQNKISCFSDKYFINILSNIGGFDDKSMDFTTRILIFLESIPLNENNDLYNNLIKNLTNIYLEEFIRENKYPLFLTNEIIRFWRTLCIDYRWKKMEIEKPWGIRNIKLRFSRKFLCVSSILLLIMLFKKMMDLEDFNKFIHYPSSIKIIIIYNLIKASDSFSKTYKQNILKSIEKILIGYDDFLSSISNEEIRESLIKIEFEDRNKNEYYKNLKRKAKEFHENIVEFLENLDEGLVRKFLIF